MLSRNEVKYIQSLFHKKNRNVEGLFIAEGVKIIHELIDAHFNIKKIYALREWIELNPEIKYITEVNADELAKISRLETPNKVLAIVEKKALSVIPDLRNKVTILLDGIQDPGNMGTIVRTADWFGIENIIASTDTADIYNPKVIQATMGSIARVNIFYENLETFLQDTGIDVFGAMLNGEDITKLVKPNECLLVVGNESKGIRQNIQPYIQKIISVGKKGNAESLNAAVATGIILWKLTA